MTILDDIMRMNAVGAGLDVGGQVGSAILTAQYGRDAQKAANFQAEQLRVNAGQAQASAQRQAENEGRRTDLVNSRALAVAAASGGGASDPTVINMIARNAGEGAYRQAVALYQGDAKANAMNLQADVTQYEGRAQRHGANMKAVAQGTGAVSTLMKSQAHNASLLQRFGGGGPKVTEAGENPWSWEGAP